MHVGLCWMYDVSIYHGLSIHVCMYALYIVYSMLYIVLYAWIYVWMYPSMCRNKNRHTYTVLAIGL